MRWDRLFADLEAGLAAEEAAERDAEIAERTRAEVAKLRLVDRLRAAGERPLDVSLVGIGSWRGQVVDTGPDWVVLRGDARGDLLAALDAVTAIAGLPRWSALPGSEGKVAQRFRIAAVLRGLARDRSTVQLVRRDGAVSFGTVDRVGADYVELAEHAVDEPRRARAVQQVRLVPFAALAGAITPHRR